MHHHNISNYCNSTAHILYNINIKQNIILYNTTAHMSHHYYAHTRPPQHTSALQYNNIISAYARSHRYKIYASCHTIKARQPPHALQVHIRSTLVSLETQNMHKGCVNIRIELGSYFRKFPVETRWINPWAVSVGVCEGGWRSYYNLRVRGREKAWFLSLALLFWCSRLL